MVRSRRAEIFALPPHRPIAALAASAIRPIAPSPYRRFALPYPAKFAGLQMAGFATATFEPAKIADVFDKRQRAHKLNWKSKGLIVRRISSHVATATDIAA
jgi:hypothetical protein